MGCECSNRNKYSLHFMKGEGFEFDYTVLILCVAYSFMCCINYIILTKIKREILSSTVGQELVDEIVVENHSFWVHSSTYFALCRQNYKTIELRFFTVIKVIPPYKEKKLGSKNKDILLDLRVLSLNPTEITCIENEF